MLKITDLNMHYPLPKRYRDYILRPFKTETVHALKDIHLDIAYGDKVAFLGSNGAGKTTLLKSVGGLLYPTTGNITINGYDSVKDNRRARRSVGFVLNEERSFYWRLSGVQNLEFFGSLDNLFGSELMDKINELLGLVGLTESGRKLVASYSSGMKQKLAIARGLLSDPEILILDEPTRTLDPISTEEVKELIRNQIHSHKERTLLIATHSLPEAEDLCNKICIMKNGKMLAFKTLEEIKNDFPSLLEFYKTTIRKADHDKLL